MQIPAFEDRLSQTIFVFLLWFLLYIPSLGTLELNFDEHKRILPAVTMLDTGEWVIPELAGRQYFKKPPLINWIIAGSFRVSGIKNEFFARLPSALLVLAFSLMILLLRSSFLDNRAKFAIVLIFLTSFAIWRKGRQSEIDASYTCLAGLSTYIWVNSFASGEVKWGSWLASFAVLGLGLLLKGPMILLFFYCVILSVLCFTGRTKDFFSLRHLCGILLMVSIFLYWGIFVLDFKSRNISGVPINKSEEISVIQTWGKELLLRFKDNLNPLKWAGRVFSSIINFFPWLVFVPLLWNKKCIENIPTDKRELFTASRFGTVLSFALVCLMPGTRPRYSMPSFAFLTILIGWLISTCNVPVLFEKIWKKVLEISGIILLISANLAAILLFLIFFSRNNFNGFVLEKLFSVFRDNLSFIKALASVIFANFAIFYAWKIKQNSKSFLNLLLCSAILFSALSLIFAYFAIPIMKLYECHRPAGNRISMNIPQDRTLYMFKVGSEHFLFYIPNKVRHIFTYGELPDSAEYLLLLKSEYDENSQYPFFRNRGARLLEEIKADKRTFSLVQFTNTQANCKSQNQGR